MAVSLNTERRNAMLAMAERGCTQEQIAREYGVSQSRVSRIINAARREEAARRADLDRAMIAKRSADDLGELLILLSKMPRIGKVREQLRRGLGNWWGYSTYARTADPSYQPSPEVRACVDALKREFGGAR